MATTIVRMICPNLNCRKVLSVPPTARGKTVRCRNCGMRIHVPAPAKRPEPEADAAVVEREKPAD